MSSSSAKEIYSLIDRLESKLNERSSVVRDDAMYKSYNHKAFLGNNSASGKYYEDQFTKTPYQQLLQTNYYQKDLGESSRTLLPSSEYEIRKLIKDEFNSMMMPFQQDINKTISLMETKFDSMEVLKGSKVNDQSSVLSIQIDKQIETHFKEIQKEFNSKMEEQRNIISKLAQNQNEIESKEEAINNESVVLKDIEEIKGDMKKIINEIKGIKEGNFSELKAMNTKSLKVIDFDQLSKCDLKTLNTLDLFQLKDISQGKGLNEMISQQSLPKTDDDDNEKRRKELSETVAKLNERVNESIEVGNSIKKLKVNDKFSEINSQISKFQSQLTAIQTSVDNIKNAPLNNNNNKPSSGIGFDEMNKINQQILGLKQQVNGMQSKQSFFIEASSLEAVSNEIKKKISFNEYHEAMTQLKTQNEDFNRAIAELNAQITKIQSNNASTVSFTQEKQDIMNIIDKRFCSIPNQDVFDEEVKKISQLENRIFILENSEKELAHKDDIKYLLDEIDKINERLNNNDNNNNNNLKPLYKDPFMITNLPKHPENPKGIQNKKSPFSMAEKDNVIDDSNNQSEFIIENEAKGKIKGKDDNNEFKTSNDEPKSNKSKNDDDFDDFDVDEIEELN